MCVRNVFDFRTRSSSRPRSRPRSRPLCLDPHRSYSTTSPTFSIGHADHVAVGLGKAPIALPQRRVRTHPPDVLLEVLLRFLLDVLARCPVLWPPICTTAAGRARDPTRATRASRWPARRSAQLARPSPPNFINFHVRQPAGQPSLLVPHPQIL